MSDIASAAGWWFARPPQWTRRHVVTLNINSNCDASLEVVIDIELPRHGSASRAWLEGKRLYVVPLVLVTKERQLAQIKLTDEAGRLVPLLTRQDNELISTAALKGALDVLLDDKNHADDVSRVKDVLQSMTTDWGPPAEIYASLAQRLLKKLTPKSTCKERFRELIQLAEDLSASTMIWVPVVGLRGEQRSFRLESHVEFDAPKILYPVVRKAISIVERVLDVEAVVEYQLRSSNVRGQYRFKGTPVDDANSRGTMRRLWNRFADTIGFAPYHLHIAAPFLKRTSSYHLQVNAPTGVDVRVMRLQPPPEVVGREYKAMAANHGHLYLSEASSIKHAAALINLHVNRRGVLFYFALTSALIAALLWFFSAHAQLASEHQEAAAATLLIVPGLLSVASSRLGEHGLVTRILSGVRVLMFLSGACSVAAAAAVAGVWIFDVGDRSYWEGISYNWHIYAKIATATAGILVLSWVLAWETVESVRTGMRRLCSSGGRYTALAIVLVGVQLLVLRSMPPSNDHLGMGQWIYPALAGLAGVLGAWVAAYGEVTNQRVSSTLLVLVGVASVVAALVFANYDDGLLSWGDYGSFVKAWVPVLAIVGFLVQRVVDANRDKEKDM